MSKYFLTSESVTIGHPDKMCDYIADCILDEYLKQDRESRVACEVVAYKNNILVTGEITSSAVVDIEGIVRKCIKDIGYDDETTGINYNTCEVNIKLEEQSVDIANGVDYGGAGDQGIMYGFATDETSNYMPITIVYAHKLAKRLELVRIENIIQGLKPDGKTQVTMEFENDIPKRVECIVISAQHEKGIEMDKLRAEIREKVIYEVIDSKYIDTNTKIYINGAGRFEIGGPLADTGLTGRKIMVDTYGGIAKHGGGAFSGKDATKVDRSGAYMARYIAKNVVANHLAKKCEVQLSYVIGLKDAVAINIDCFGTESIPLDKLIQIVTNKFRISPQEIISTLKLREPIYSKLSAYGHMGRDDLDLEWEKIIPIYEF